MEMMAQTNHDHLEGCMSREKGSEETAAPIQRPPEGRRSDALSELKDTIASAQLQSARAVFRRSLARTRAQYPLMRKALLHRAGVTLEPDYDALHRGLDLATLADLVAAQAAQDKALRIIQWSVAQEQTAGQQQGHKLAAIILNQDLFDAAGARVIADAGIALDIYAVEIITGIIPLAAIGYNIILAHHVLFSRDLTMEETARRSYLHSGNALTISIGCRDLFKQYAHARRFDIRFDTSLVFRILTAHISRASHIQFQDEQRDWGQECRTWLRSTLERIPTDEGGPRHTLLELDALIGFVREIGERQDELEYDLECTGGSGPRAMRAGEETDDDYRGGIIEVK